MKKTFFNFIGTAIFLSMMIIPTSFAAPKMTLSKMIRVWENGQAVRDSKVTETIVNAVKEGLTKGNMSKSIVVEARDEAKKAIMKRNDPFSANVKNVGTKKLGMMFRVLVDGYAVVDSQDAGVIIGVTKDVMAEQWGQRIEIMPRDSVVNHDKAVFMNIRTLASQGKVVGSDTISLGSTRADAVKKLGTPTMEKKGDQPGTTDLIFANQVGCTCTNIDNKIVFISEAIHDQFKQRFMDTQKELVKVFGKPYITTTYSKDAKEKLIKMGMPKKMEILPVYTYKAGKKYIHFITFQINNSVVQATMTIVDAGCNALKSLK